MSLPDRMNRAINYIEENLQQEIRYEEAAKIACCSEYHFSRLFAAIMDVSLSDYIRQRKLTLAAFDLQTSERKVIDVANTYGYESADAFSKAFLAFHGIRPSQARQSGASLRTFPRMSLQMQVKGGTAMEYRIEELDFSFDVVGVKKTVETSKAFEIVPALWGEAQQNGLLQQLIDMAWEDPQCKLESLLGVTGDTASIETDTFEYMLGVRYQNDLPEGMEKITIPATTWAVFPNTQETWKRIYTEWLPASNYTLADAPCIECFYPPDHTPQREIWVPVKACG